jgi:hypothetical protein
MKKIATLILGLGLCLAYSQVEASIAIDNSSRVSFSTVPKSISKISNTDYTHFEIQAESIVNLQNIAYWKVRTYCDQQMVIKVANSMVDSCGKVVTLPTLTNNSFSLYFDNQTATTKKFSVKLKAYDQNGKWLYTDKENFTWK